jgi:hypothetical protein
MGYAIVESCGQQFAVDWEVIERLCRSYWVSFYQLHYASAIDIAQSVPCDSLSCALPPLRALEVQWTKVDQGSSMATIIDMMRYRSRGRALLGVREDMRSKVWATRANKRKFSAMMRGITQTNVSALARSEGCHPRYPELARFMQDISPEAAMIGLQVASGAKAFALLNTATMLKGWVKYRDAQNMGAALVRGSGSMVLGMFRLHDAKLGNAARHTLLVAHGSPEASTSYISGDGFCKAVEAGLLKMASTGVAHGLFAADKVRDLCARMPIPFTTRWSITSPGASHKKANPPIQYLAHRLAKKRSNEGANHLLQHLHKTTPSGLAALGPLDDLALLDLAIIEISRGTSPITGAFLQR